MRLDWTQHSADALRAALLACEDAQQTAPDEYVVDLYEIEAPMSLELSFEEGVHVLAAETMSFDEEMDGWYLSGPVTDAAAIESALRTLF